ncbi:MAG: hypothetical protein JHC55_00740 [Mycolicibacterium sp.]|nr:hypothetical protein [Mycolicibacterium sp.]
MNTAVASIVVAVVAVVGAVVGAAVSAWLNRDRDDAEVAQKVSQAWDPVFNRYDKEFERLGQKCDKCEVELRKMRGDFGRFTDVMEELVPDLPPDLRRKAQVAIRAARASA